jgi:hypothetical protein
MVGGNERREEKELSCNLRKRLRRGRLETVQEEETSYLLETSPKESQARLKQGQVLLRTEQITIDL